MDAKRYKIDEFVGKHDDQNPVSISFDWYKKPHTVYYCKYCGGFWNSTRNNRLFVSGSGSAVRYRRIVGNKFKSQELANAFQEFLAFIEKNSV